MSRTSARNIKKSAAKRLFLDGVINPLLNQDLKVILKGIIKSSL